MRIYQNLKQINIILFWEIAESEDYKQMDIDFEDSRTYSDTEIINLRSAFLVLYDEYFEAKDSSSQRNTLQSNDKQSKETFKLNLLNEMYKTIQLLEYNKSSLKDEDFFELLNKTYDAIILLEKKVHINRMDSVKFNAEKLKRVIDALNNKLLLSDTRTKQKVKEEVKKFKNHYNNIASIEQILERSIGNIESINCLQWLAYENQAELIIKSRKQNGNRSTK